MDKLWSKRRPPTPLEWDAVMEQQSDANGSSEGLIKDQVLWTLPQCLQVLESSTNKLSQAFKALSSDDHLVWDKDDPAAMDFVTACANIRAHIFGIGQKTRFDIKSMAGNIIPAVATTNAVVAGLLVLEAIKVLDGRLNDCRTVYVNRGPNPRGRILVPCRLEKPVEKCYVCSARNEVNVQVNTSTFTLAALQDKVIKGTLNMVAPDVEIDGKGIVLISSDPDDGTDANLSKTLQDFKVVDGTRLQCDDFLQDYTLYLTILHSDSIEEGAEFRMVGDLDQLQKVKESASEETAKPAEEDDDVCMVEEPVSTKRKPEEDVEGAKPTKRARTENEEEIVCL